MAVKRIDVVVKMGGVEIDAFQRESDTSGRVHIDSVIDDVEINVTYSNKDDGGFNYIPFIIIGVVVLIAIAGTVFVIKKKKGTKPKTNE